MTGDGKSDTPDDDSILEAIEASATPIDDLGSRAGTDDRDPIAGEFSGNAVIGMGEASHGTRESFRVRRRLFERLVEDADVRLLALETNFSATRPIDEYVRTGDGDPEALLSTGAINWPYRCRAVLEVIEWAREFNRGREPGDRVGIYGIDADSPSAPAVPLASYLQTAGAGDAVGEDLEYLVAVDGGEADPEAVTRDRLLETADRVVSGLRETFDERESEFVEATGDRAFQLARRHLDVLELTRDVMSEDDDDVTRDGAMAENVEWILDREPTDRIVVWAHNGHLKRGSVGAPHSDAPALGECLHRRFDGHYYALATAFDGGTVRVISRADGDRFDYGTYDVPEPPAGSIPDRFGEVGGEPFVVDLADLSDDPAAAEWLDGTPKHHFVAASMDGDRSPYAAWDLPEAFDAVAFVGASTPTEPVAPLFPELAE